VSKPRAEDDFLEKCLFFYFRVTPAVPLRFQSEQKITLGQTFQFGLHPPPVFLLRFREKIFGYLLVLFDGVHLLTLQLGRSFGNAKPEAIWR
jgi:hypothetical protein